MRRNYDVAVIGAGHAGCEAANATAKMGFKTLLLTINFNNIAFMPCNPSVGGPGKSNLVREVDALGGLIGRNTDRAHIQMRALNTQKGPAVRALRAQTDKHLYQQYMQEYMEKQPLITIRQGEVVALDRSKDLWRLTLSTGITFEVPVVIIAYRYLFTGARPYWELVLSFRTSRTASGECPCRAFRSARAEI